MNIKFRMPKFGRDLKLTGMTKELTMSTLATTISIILTFGTAHWLEQRDAEHSRKLLAMTAIHDIDESIEVLKRLKFNEEQGNTVTRYLMANVDRLEEVSDDTLFIFFNYVSNNSWNTQEEFVKTNENIFNSSQESWSTLDDRTFINNLQTFYHSRAVLERVMKDWFIFKKPVNDEELYQTAMASEGMMSRETFLPICRQLLGTIRVQRYSATSFQRLGVIQQYLNQCIDLNEENKFLMNITDEDMLEFVNTTIKKVHPATEKDLLGKWTAVFSDNQKLEYDFHKDHTFHTNHTIYSIHPLFTGRIAVNHSFTGKWAVENDSLVIYFDITSLKVEVDENGIAYPQENTDSIRALKNQVLSEDYKKSYLAPLSDMTRQSRASNIDRTGKRLELTDPQGQSTHYQRSEAAE
jgi:hypothetical protein